MSFTSFLQDRQGSPMNSSSPTSSELFQSATFDKVPPSPQPTASGSSPNSSTNNSAPTASTLFSGSSFDPARLHPLAGLGAGLDHLDLLDDTILEVPGGESVLPSRNWSDELCYGAGTTYLSGLIVGGAWGFKEGMSRSLGSSTSARLRLNSVLNGCTRRGSFVGNSAGVLGVFYNLTNSSIDAIRGRHDVAGGIIAGGVSGVLFKATAGVKPALVGGVIMMGASGLWAFAKSQIM